MQITRSNITISEIRDTWDRKELIVNRNYQRSATVWPDAARSYLIDTILNQYVVPKVYFYQTFDKARKRVIREIVDGQQRLTTILDFLRDSFALNNRSPNFQGMRFSDLDDAQQQAFLTYQIEVDIVHSAMQTDLLAMFTRMNAYTAPLNPAEKRHAEFEGNFKWFIIETNATVGQQLVDFGILTPKQSVRMQDAEFITELALVLDIGIINKAESSFSQIYKRYNQEFPQERNFREKILEFMRVLTQDFLPLRDTFLTKSYVIHSLFCAMMQRKYGIPRGEELGIDTDGVFFNDLEATLNNLAELVSAHEVQDTAGPFGEYVSACLSTTHRIKQREIRSSWIGKALA